MVVRRCSAQKSKSDLFFHYHGLEFESELNLLQRAGSMMISMFFLWNIKYWLAVNAQVVKMFWFLFMILWVRVRVWGGWILGVSVDQGLLDFTDRRGRTVCGV